MTNMQRVTLTVELDVNLDAWGETYGFDHDEVPDDVHTYLVDAVTHTPGASRTRGG